MPNWGSDVLNGENMVRWYVCVCVCVYAGCSKKCHPNTDKYLTDSKQRKKGHFLSCSAVAGHLKAQILLSSLSEQMSPAPDSSTKSWSLEFQSAVSHCSHSGRVIDRDAGRGPETSAWHYPKIWQLFLVPAEKHNLKTPFSSPLNCTAWKNR